MFAVLSALIPVLCLAGCAAGRHVASPQDAIVDSSGESERSAVDASEGTFGEADAPPPADGAVREGTLIGLAEPEFSESRGLGPDLEASGGEPAVNPATLVAEALETCESARVFWEKGDFEGALARLDLAYELLLQIPDDADVIQQKEDLRHLISRRIVEIYRSRRTTAAELGSPIPIEINAHVEREIARFRGSEQKFFLESYRRSGQYRPMIVRKLRESGLPEELSWLPLVESGFKTRALSRARALGMWQFISSTGSRYGLKRSHWIDERMDPERSTAAAIEYLTALHGMFGDWMMALAGYNCGEHRVMSVIRRQENGYLDRFWDLFGQLPWETARYVPRFLATLLIVNDPEKYGFELPDPLPPLDYDTVAVARHVRLTDLDRALGLEKETIAGLNPELRRGTTPAETYGLKVPPAVAPSFDTRLAELPSYVPPPEQSYAIHRVRRGETLSVIARRHRTSVNAIVRVNHLRSRNRIRVGQRLKIPQRGGSAAASAVIATGSQAASLRYTVRRGDSLWKLASRYGTTVDRIKRDNGLRGDRLAIGQKLTIKTGVPAGSRRYTVRRGDTIGRIAEAHNVPINSILRSNGLSLSSTIYSGQVLTIPD
ncbi:MAG: LysM peptidoglycan-binding domain-containing protein [Deltaproteobacteria bacterium]|nr:LysM peptidoglycan-binding domain-containing protein [Deltaproteobacteria bacterium]